MSEWKESGIKRRDFRSIRNGPETPPHRSKKNTAKWCRGKVGKEHDWHEVIWYPSYLWHDRAPRYVQDVCSLCGKRKGFRRADGSASII
jgi:hypothetical protein